MNHSTPATSSPGRFRKAFGRSIPLIRLRKGESLDSLANACDMSPGSLAAIEAGEDQAVDLDAADLIASALGTSLRELVAVADGLMASPAPGPDKDEVAGDDPPGGVTR